MGPGLRRDDDGKFADFSYLIQILALKAKPTDMSRRERGPHGSAASNFSSDCSVLPAIIGRAVRTVDPGFSRGS